jgi:hypothetical protein
LEEEKKDEEPDVSEDQSEGPTDDANLDIVKVY